MRDNSDYALKRNNFDGAEGVCCQKKKDLDGVAATDDCQQD
jgi:hypothetical protein